ncbi:MAG: DeoR/GlpR family DNA-binding transcription regulator [Bacteroidales bacterium]|jgi:DeoR/GlpR family transcriptional regulator of sugar metabolism|nr:DeoR/GlpR family DNA-binding transcription regulator [Bacteroidales bacterium]
MLKEERQRYIIDRINADNRIYVTELSEELGISDDTLRRDLIDLEKLGLLTKVHGGAIARSEISIQFTERLNTATLIKQQMAAKLVPMFKEGDVILIDGGTSTLEVARQIPKDKRFTVYTNCLPIANELSGYPNVELILLGGKVFSSSQVTVGISVFQMLQSVYPDWVIIGISDIHPQKGLTDSDREEAIIKRSMLLQGTKRVVIADAHKLETARNFHVASLGEIDYIVTEDSKVDYIKQHWPKYSYEVV